MTTTRIPASFQIATIALLGAALIAGGSASALAAGKPVHTYTAAPSQTAKTTVTAQSLNYESSLVSVKARIPVIRGMKDARYQAELNDIIARHAAEDIELLKQVARVDYAKAKKGGYPFHKYELVIDYAVHANTSGILSFELETYRSYDRGDRIDAYNVKDGAAASRMTLADLFGENYETVVNEAIRAQIAKKANAAVYAFEGISAEPTFYIEGKQAIVVFQKYEIAPGSEGAQSFAIAIPQGE
ncbi:DUF3298 and DUF4163 domain-containing protein [Paenibacillus methanolicus]|uniref:Uncharacterized protein DUF4163 n=1 Tax=Paenibacillus methanolicus TaxID=582686 RepID=A0A5S5BYF5_9BACL|nr:DUF3298 and DUF4163 domain-containing protein [Paenibacillus methanolicus]TYP71326.1 uncharacterized protein DUF4163 [Paenibacillus methanolicus]